MKIKIIKIMNKRYLLLFALLVCCLSGTLAQTEAEADSLRSGREKSLPFLTQDSALIYRKAHKDSLSVFKQKTHELMGTLFKPDPQLRADSVFKAFDDTPSFGIYKNNYITVGTTLFKTPTAYNSDAKFQISVMQRLTNSVLPFRTYLFLTYTQLAYWNIFRESFPFGDINFNPTLGIGRALVYNNRFVGTLGLQLEHESNGKDGPDSRSWNKVSFMALLKFNRNWTFQTKAWIPIVDGNNNKDIVDYKGWGFMAVDFNHKSRYNIGLIVTKRGGSNLNANVTLNCSFRITPKSNQYLFLEYYNGYGEEMLNYKEFRQRIRLGFVIKPNFLFFY
ncbi:phospholipase A1 [Dysgonomonas sp. PH5-45]|uniref:phospholipase A n=1 Tax=unclassified Dysgonomonas TaxID=2630389 RepID=UPI002475CC55|nr:MULTISPECIES: phospholipase A [unclassified Dysgonomonas]MDH6354959.1 phospholipase A1 [Dysgonomonas sp. PH5-45]MDH6387917.1 phospholipase A1 [Dysgonomonas sp. PH5-37]